MIMLEENVICKLKASNILPTKLGMLKKIKSNENKAKQMQRDKTKIVPR